MEPASRSRHLLDTPSDWGLISSAQPRVYLSLKLQRQIEFDWHLHLQRSCQGEVDIKKGNL